MDFKNKYTLLKIAFSLLLLIAFFSLFEVETNFSNFYSASERSIATSEESEFSVEEEDRGIVNLASVSPAGTPRLYGDDLDLKYDDVSANDRAGADRAIGKMASLDRNIELQGDDLERYIYLLYDKEGGMSCEYCCGARSIIFENGEAACGCAHSFAMRGVAKYLITEYGDDFSDEEILSEVGKWKVLFFPEIHSQKAEVLEEEGFDTDYIALTTNTYRGIEEGSTGGGMVGGC